MKKHQLLVLVAASGLLGGCAATITPRGEVYTEAYWAEPTVVVETYTPTVMVPLKPHPVGPIAKGPHYHRPAVRPVRQGPRVTVPRPHANRPPVHYGAPGQHRSPGQHRAPGIRGPRTHRRPAIGGQSSKGQHGPLNNIRGPQQNVSRPQGRK